MYFEKYQGPGPRTRVAGRSSSYHQQSYGIAGSVGSAFFVAYSVESYGGHGFAICARRGHEALGVQMAKAELDAEASESTREKSRSLDALLALAPAT